MNKENILSNKYPEIAKEWDYVKNKDLLPSEILPNLSEKVWWICSEGHSYDTKVSSRTRNGTGCPYCVGKKVWKGFNDLETRFPNIAKEWAYELNDSNITPNNIYFSSRTKVWWECSEGHFYEEIVNNRTIKNKNCPYCSNKKLLSGFNDLETKFPKLAKEWDIEKNNGLIPSDILYTSKDKFHWICSKGHSFETSLSFRINRGYGCPYCANVKTLTGYNDLATKFPEIAKEWDYTKNGDRLPTNVPASGTYEAYWLCPTHNHSYQMTINHRTSGDKRSCPYCSGQRLLVGFNDFKTNYPEAAKYWDYEKNKKRPEDYTRRSNAKVYWICSRGHSWRTTISHLAEGHGCPECSKFLKKSFREICVYYYIYKYFPDAISTFKGFGFELDIYIPSLNVGIEYDGQLYHKKTEKDLIKNKKCEEVGTTIYRIREKDCGILDDEISINIILEGISYKDLDVAIYKLLMDLFCKNNIEAKEDIVVNINSEYGKILESYEINVIRENNIYDSDLPFKNEWNYDKNKNISPKSISINSNMKFWWTCENRHDWLDSPNNRRNTKSGLYCPYCNNRKVLIGFNDFQSKFPNISKHWNYDLNDKKPSEVIYVLSKPYNFTCEKGHNFKLKPKDLKEDVFICPHCKKETNKKLKKEELEKEKEKEENINQILSPNNNTNETTSKPIKLLKRNLVPKANELALQKEIENKKEDN